MGEHGAVQRGKKKKTSGVAGEVAVQAPKPLALGEAAEQAKFPPTMETRLFNGVWERCCPTSRASWLPGCWGSALRAPRADVGAMSSCSWPPRGVQALLAHTVSPSPFSPACFRVVSEVSWHLHGTEFSCTAWTKRAQNPKSPARHGGNAASRAGTAKMETNLAGTPQPRRARLNRLQMFHVSGLPGGYCSSPGLYGSAPPRGLVPWGLCPPPRHWQKDGDEACQPLRCWSPRGPKFCPPRDPFLG